MDIEDAQDTEIKEVSKDVYPEIVLKAMDQIKREEAKK